jgi:hypothetical protein
MKHYLQRHNIYGNPIVQWTLPSYEQESHLIGGQVLFSILLFIFFFFPIPLVLFPPIFKDIAISVGKENRNNF